MPSRCGGGCHNKFSQGAPSTGRAVAQRHTSRLAARRRAVRPARADLTQRHACCVCRRPLTSASPPRKSTLPTWRSARRCVCGWGGRGDRTGHSVLVLRCWQSVCAVSHANQGLQAGRRDLPPRRQHTYTFPHLPCARVVQMIKESLDKKFGPSWHVVVGRHFAFDITYEASGWWDRVLCRAPLCDQQRTSTGRRIRARPAVCCALFCNKQLGPCQNPLLPFVFHVQCKNMLYVYVGGSAGVLVWKM